MSQIRLITKDKDVELYAQHLFDHMSDSGKNNNIIYTPYETGYRHAYKEMKENLERKIKGDLNSVDWKRAFGLFHEQKVVGHLDLSSYHLEAASHRCRLGMGIDPSHRGLGHGMALLNYAKDWVKNHSSIEWIDLYTFSHNTPAIALYKKFGFVQAGAIDDMFRVDGEKIRDIQMFYQIKR